MPGKVEESQGITSVVPEGYLKFLLQVAYEARVVFLANGQDLVLTRVE